MSEIKGFDLSRLTQDENFGFHSFAIVEFEKCKDSKITELSLIHISEPTRPY